MNGMRGLDARVLLWTALPLLLSGAALMVWFDAGAPTPWPAVALALRAVHGASAALLLGGTAWHLVSRLRRPSPPEAVRSGARALAVVGIAAWTGAAVAQTGAGKRLLASVGLGPDPLVAVGLLHVGVGSALVGLFLYLHLARHGWRRLRGTPRHALLALVAVAAVALLGTAPPGSRAVWSGGTTLAVPPWMYLWTWPLLLAAFAAGAAGKTGGTSAK